MSNCCCKQKTGCSPWITGEIETSVGNIPTIGTRLTFRDELGALKVHFGLRDRIAVIPVELVIWFKQALGLAVTLALLSGISRSGFSWANAPRAFGLVLPARFLLS